MANVGHQLKFAARAAVLWQALKFVERQEPRAVGIGWVPGPGLAAGEDVHFIWHLTARGEAHGLAIIDSLSRASSAAPARRF
jgi:hypothetical protein